MSKILAERLTKARITSGYTQNEIAELLGCGRVTITNYESGRRNPDIDTLVKLSQYYNVSADYLLGLSDAQTNDKGVQFICDYTGLSNSSIDILHYFSEFKYLSPVINFLIESEKRFFIDELTNGGCDFNYDVILKDRETLGLTMALQNYFSTKPSKKDRTLQISVAGNIKDSDNFLEDNPTLEDFFPAKILRESEIIDKVLLDNITEKIKKGKKLFQLEAGDENANNSEA